MLRVDEGLRRVLLAALVVGLALSITLAQTALTLLALRLVFRLATGRARPGWPLGWAFTAWAGASLLAALVSARPWPSLLAAKDLLLIATFYVLLDAVVDLTEVERWGRWLFALLAAVALVGVFQVALCPWLAGLEPLLGRVARKCHRAHAFYSIYMTLAGVLSLMLLSSLPRVLVAPSASAVLVWLVGGAGLAATYVRGAWMGLLAGVVVLLGLMPRGRWLAVGGAAVLALLVLLTPGLRQRAESIVDPTDPTARERRAMWTSALQIARDHPVTGVGPGQVKREYPRYVAPEYRGKPRGHVHNTPLQILAERGALGLVAWLAVFAAFFWRALSVLRALPPQALRERALVAGSAAAIAGFLVGGLTEYNFGDSEVALMAYTVMAVPFVVARGVSKRPAPGPA